MASTFTSNKSIELPANNDYVNDWNVPVNGDFSIIDKCFGGVTNLNVVSLSGIVALTLTQYQAPMLFASGALTANLNYQLPSGVGGFWFFYNGTSGAFTLTMSSAGGGSNVTLPQGQRSIVISDGTNVFFATTVTPSAAGSSGDLQYNSSGSFAGASGITTDGSNLVATGNIIAAGAITGATGQFGSITGVNLINVGGFSSAADMTFNAIYAPTSSTSVGFRGVPVTTQTGNYTFALTDAGTTVNSSATAASIFTIPANASVPFPIGSAICVVNDGSQTLSIAITSDTLIWAGTGSAGTRTVGQTGLVTLLKISATIWYISGAGIS